MKYQDVAAFLTQDEWDVIAEHSDVEKAALLHIIHIAHENRNSLDFEQKIVKEIEANTSLLKHYTDSLEMNLPTRSIRSTLLALVALMDSIADDRLGKFLRSLRTRILKSSKITYYPPLTFFPWVEGEPSHILIGETKQAINVKCRLHYPIAKIICDYKEKVIIVCYEGEKN